MKVAVAISHPALEREVISALKLEGKEVIRRCLDDADIRAVPSEVPIYSDSHFHARHPETILVRSATEISTGETIRTHTIGVVGPHGAPGTSTIALNLAVALKAAVIDAAPYPALSAMTGLREGPWHGAVVKAVPTGSLHTELSKITSAHTVIDLGSGPINQLCDELIVVISAHPISVERYLQRLQEFSVHRLVINRMEPGPIGQTAHRMITTHPTEIVVVPRDDKACAESFVSARPLVEVAPKSAIVRAIKTLAGVRERGGRGRVIAVG